MIEQLSPAEQYRLQGGRCWLCGVFTLPQNLTRAHLYANKSGMRDKHGGAWCLAHKACNKAMGCTSAGSTRFVRWIRGVINRGDPSAAKDPIRRRRANQRAVREVRNISEGTLAAIAAAPGIWRMIDKRAVDVLSDGLGLTPPPSKD